MVVENGRTRRPDVVLFVNGLPLAVIFMNIKRLLGAPAAEGQGDL